MLKTIPTAALVLSAGAAPVLAQDAMSAHGGTDAKGQMTSGSTKMSDADMRMAKTCGAMSHDEMSKDAGCARLTQAHPDMMKHDSMMSSGH